MNESCRLFFREEGSLGKTVVIVHGLFGSSDNWMTIGKKLSVTHHVFMVDQRNHGRSPHCNTHSYEAMKEDIVRFFKDREIEKASLIGHSMGGKVAMAFAADYPELIEKLVIVDIAPRNYFLAGENKQHRLIIETLKELRENFVKYNSRNEIGMFLNKRINDPDVVLFILKSIYRDKKTGVFACRLNMDVLDKSLDSIVRCIDEQWLTGKIMGDCPVLFIKGEKSPYITDSDIRVIRKIYHNVQIETISDAGHWLHAEQPEQFLEVLQNFLS